MLAKFNYYQFMSVHLPFKTMFTIYRELKVFFNQLARNKSLLLSLTINDFKAQYMANYLGLLWAFAQPLVMLCIMWFIFQVGFKATPVKGVPFILWLACGMLPWLFFSDSISKGTSSILDNSFLVKKIAFRASTLPLVKLGGGLVIHAFFVVLLMAMFLYYGYYPSVYWLQIPYYVFCTCILILGISWFTSSTVVFIRDISQFIAICLQLGFWLTPIFWSMQMIPEKFQILFKLNPVYYIVDGYRGTFIYHTWFWENSVATLLFLIQVSVILVLGASTFRKLRPHFANVL